MCKKFTVKIIEGGLDVKAQVKKGQISYFKVDTDEVSLH